MPAPDERSELTEQEAERVFVVDRDIDADSVAELKPRIMLQLEERGPNLWLDLRHVQFVDSTGLGLLVGLLREARQRGGTVRLLNASREVRRVLQITGLESLFEIGATTRT